MVKRLLIVLFMLVKVTCPSWSQTINKNDHLRDLVRQYRQAEVSIPYPGPVAIDTLTRNVSITSVRDKTVLINISPRTLNWFISANYDYTIIPRTENKGLVSAENTAMAMDWQSYPTYSQYDSIMRSFSVLYPSLCRLDTIGTSIYGKYIFALKISDNPLVNEDEPEVFYTSSMHGDETGGFVLMLRLADYLLKNYNLNSRAKNMVDNLEIWINPLANPDGTYGTGNTMSSPVRDNANGYDLNRNFPDPLDPSIVPQKENVDMIKFLRKHRFTISANFHAGAEVVNYPWDRWLSRIHADDSWFNNISRAYADTVHKYSGPAYMSFMDNGVTRGAVWYIIYGGRQDFVTWGLQGREVTIELDYSKVTPAAQLELLWQYNWRSLMGYLENALYGIHGIVRDKHTNNPVPAKIFISGHDKDSSQVFADTISGSFIRMLSPGVWDLTFSANGYRDTVIYNVQVIEGQKTDLYVEMTSSITGIDTTERLVPLLYPNPATSGIRVKLPGEMNGRINVSIISQSGVKVADYNSNYVFGYPMEIDISGLSGGGYTIIFKNTITRASCRSRFIVVGRTF